MVGFIDTNKEQQGAIKLKWEEQEEDIPSVDRITGWIDLGNFVQPLKRGSGVFILANEHEQVLLVGEAANITDHPAKAIAMALTGKKAGDVSQVKFIYTRDVASTKAVYELLKWKYDPPGNR